MKRLLFAALLLVVLHLSVFAQATTQVTGTVSDPSGGVIPNASIEIENTATGVKRSGTSDQSGSYAFLQVAPGTYRFTIKANGFRTTAVNDVQLLVNNPATINIKLEVGQVTETVAVTADAEQLNTVDASLGNAIGNKPIVELPLNARNIVGLLALQPGVVFTKDEDTSSRNGVVNGGKSDQANVTLDGVDVNDQMDRNAFTSVLRMTPDAVQEFRVTTSNAGADQGRSSGAQVSLVTKSGTNEVHGALYAYHRNTVTTANDFFLNKAGLPRQKLIRNIYGVSLGGPIIKNKFFIFGNWEGRRDAKDGQQLRYVPSMLMRTGTLQYRTTSGAVAQVAPAEIAAKLDPRGVNQAALTDMQKYPVPNDFSVGDGLNFQGYRFTAPTPLRWNTYITKLDYVLDSQNKHTLFFRGNLQNDNEQGLPQFPGLPANTVLLRNNKGFGTGLTSVISPTLVSNFRYGLTRQGGETSGINNFSVVTLRGMDPFLGTNRSIKTIIPVHTIAEDMNWIKGNHTVQFGAVLRLSQNRRDNYGNSFHSASSNASWLVNSGADLNSPWSNMASSQITNFRWAMSDVMGLVTQGNAQYNYLVDGTVLKNGDPVARNFKNQEYEFYVQDTWRVNRAFTVTAGLRWSLMPPIYEANGQQVSPNIPIGDWFDKRGGLAQQGKSQSEAGLISFVPRDKGGRPLYPFHKDNFAPRVSFAYSPQGNEGLSKFLFGGAGKSSIRAGWGMYYDLFGSSLMRSYDATAFGLSNALTNPAATLTIQSAPRYTGITNIPAGLLPAAPEAKFPATYPNAFAITNGLDDTLRAPYNMNLNFSWGREFTGGWFVQGSYVGRLSRRSLIRRDAAMPTDLKDPKSGMTYFQAAGILADQVNAGVPTANVQKVPYWENLFSKAATSTLSSTQVVYNRFRANQYDWTYALYQLDTPLGNCTGANRCSDLGPYAFYNPQFSYLSVFSSVGGGNYHAAQLNVRKRFTNGDTFDVNYTFGKSIDLRSNVERVGTSTGVLWNPWQPGLMKGVSDYDNTHLFSMQGVYNLPFGKGKKFASSIPGWANAIIGGWQLSGLWRWSSGFPISVFETGLWPTNWNNNNWARWTGVPVKTGSYKNMTDPNGDSGPGMFADADAASNAFTYENPGGIGTRNGLRGDGVFNIDTNIAKKFFMPWSDKHTVTFRWETFNLTNTTRFDVDSASLDISAAGTFGRYSATLSNPRVMQFGLRYDF